MDEEIESMYRTMQGCGQIEKAAQIIDPYAFNGGRQPQVKRQRIARTKARMVLADANESREELLDALLDAHHHIEELLRSAARTHPSLIVPFGVSVGIGRRSALLARHGRSV